MIDMSSYRVIYNQRVLNAVALDTVDYGDDFGLQRGDKMTIKPKFLGVLAINEDGNITLIHDEAWCFQFIPVLKEGATTRDKLIDILGSFPVWYSTIKERWMSEAVNKLADHLLANGVIVLPCRVGDTVYTNINGTGLHNSFRVESVDLVGFSNGIYSWTWHQLGKSVFLTLEEADRALKGGAEE